MPRKVTGRRAGSKPKGAPTAPERVSYAIKRRAEGGRYTEVRDEIAARWGISKRAAEMDLARANTELARIDEHEKPAWKRQIRDRILRIADDAREEGELKVELEACRDWAKLDGLMSPAKSESKVDMTASVDVEQTLNLAKLTAEERKALLVLLPAEGEGNGENV